MSADPTNPLHQASFYIAKSIFVDGVMHGVALAAGLRGEPTDRERAS